ncbi:MAG: hypothetical protein H6687_01235 [Bacillales bacterium]|nr:hypothetical protein [Bacillales bacterium]
MEWLYAFLGALVGAVFGGVIMLITQKSNLKKEYKKLYAETVSKSRNEWATAMKNWISKILAIAKMSQGFGTQQGNTNTEEYYKSRNQILIRLNLKEPLHVALKEEIKKLDDCTVNNYQQIEDEIISISQKMFKKEWERVKAEAGEQQS